MAGGPSRKMAADRSRVRAEQSHVGSMDPAHVRKGLPVDVRKDGQPLDSVGELP